MRNKVQEEKVMRKLILILSVLLGLGTANAQTVGKALVVYFSENGSTRGIAERIHYLIECDLVEI